MTVFTAPVPQANVTAATSALQTPLKAATVYTMVKAIQSNSPTDWGTRKRKVDINMKLISKKKQKWYEDKMILTALLLAYRPYGWRDKVIDNLADLIAEMGGVKALDKLDSHII